MIGGTVARLATVAGHQVVLSNSRGPETLKDLADELGPLARAGTTEEAAAVDIVVVSIPVKAYGSVPAGPLAGRVVIDTGNYYPQRDGQIADIDSGSPAYGAVYGSFEDEAGTPADAGTVRTALAGARR